MTTSKPTKGKNPPKKEPPMVKPKYNKRANPSGRKGNPRASRKGDQRDHTTESHRTPTTVVHTTKIAGKAEHLESQNKPKSQLK